MARSEEDKEDGLALHGGVVLCEEEVVTHPLVRGSSGSNAWCIYKVRCGMAFSRTSSGCLRWAMKVEGK